MQSAALVLHRLEPPPRDCARVDALLAEAETWVSTTLARGRPPHGSAGPTRLLGRILEARLQATRLIDDPGTAATVARLAVAEQSLRAVLDQRHARRSHALEWVIIALIALDIVVASL